MEEASQIESLTKALTDNSHCLVRHAQELDTNNKTLVECTQHMARQFETLDLGGLEDRGNNSRLQTGKIRILDGSPKYFESWIKEIEKQAFINRYDDTKKAANCISNEYGYSLGLH